MRAPVFLAILLNLLALGLPVAVGEAVAQPRYGRPEMRDGIQPLDRILPGIRRQHPGNFYDAEGPTYGPSGDPHYHLKWMTPDGRVIWYDADARNGRVLRSSPGRDNFDSQARRPYMGEPYDNGYGRRREQERNYDRPPAYVRPPYDGDRGDGNGRGDDRGRWRR